LCLFSISFYVLLNSFIYSCQALVVLSIHNRSYLSGIPFSVSHFMFISFHTQHFMMFFLFICSICYITYFEIFYDDDLLDNVPGVLYSFKGIHDIFNGFADGEMGNSDEIDFFSLCLTDDDKTFRKSDSVRTTGYRVVLPSCISVSTFLFSGILWSYFSDFFTHIIIYLVLFFFQTILLLDDNVFDVDNLLRFVRMPFSTDDLLRATLVSYFFFVFCYSISRSIFFDT